MSLVRIGVTTGNSDLLKLLKPTMVVCDAYNNPLYELYNEVIDPSYAFQLCDSHVYHPSIKGTNIYFCDCKDHFCCYYNSPATNQCFIPIKKRNYTQAIRNTVLYYHRPSHNPLMTKQMIRMVQTTQLGYTNADTATKSHTDNVPTIVNITQGNFSYQGSPPKSIKITDSMSCHIKW